MPDAGLPPERPAQDEVALGPMAESLGFLLRLAQIDAFAAWFDALGDEGMRPGEVSALMLIGLNPGVRQGVLARHLRIKRAHMAKMARALEEAGLIRREVPEDDRRANALSLTAEGRARMDALGPLAEAHEAQPAPNLTSREEAELKRLLRKTLDLNAPEEGR